MLECMKCININKIISTVILVVVQFLPISVFAEKIDADQAAAIASRFFSSKFKNDSGIKPLSMYGDNTLKNSASEDAYYVFTTSSVPGFVIVSGDDRFQPIVGYSTENRFDSDNVPEGLAAYLSDYAMVVKSMSEKNIEYKPATRGGLAVEPLMKVQWNQSEPYDRLTPLYGNDHTPTGCVATAIAQVMKYHNFPPSGRGTVSTQNMSVELGHAYDWDTMLDKYVYYYPDDYQYTDAQAMAVATLMRDVGYSVNMDYGRSASSANTARIPGAMCRYFNYSPEIKYVIRSSYSTQAWIDEIRANLLRGEPVLYGGTDGRYGHQFVCDGIDADDMLHINWGWGGSSDGYFDMNVLSPDNLGIGAGNGAYYRDQDMVINIRPGDPSADYQEKKFPLTVDQIFFAYSSDIGDDGKVNSSSFGLSVRIHNSTGSDVTREEYGLALCIYDKDGKCVHISNPNAVSSLYQGYYYDAYVSLYHSSLIEDGVLTDGKYKVSVVCFEGDFRYSSDNNLTPDDIIPLSAGDLNCVGVTIKDGVLYLDDTGIVKDNPQRDIRISDATTSGAFYTGVGSNYITINLQNNSTALENSSYSLFLVPENEVEEGKLYDCSAIGYLTPYIYPGVSQVIDVEFSLYDITPGRYRVFLGKYVWDYENDVNGYKPIACDKPIIIVVQELPADRLVLTSKLKLGRSDYSRRTYNYFDFSFAYNNPGPRFTATLQLWAHPEGGDESQEILLFQKEDHTFYNGSSSVSLDDWGVDECLWFENLGDYEAYLKYVDAEEKSVLIEGENNYAKFTLVEDDSEERIVLASPMIINGGKPVVAKEYSEFDVELELMSPTGISMAPDQYFVSRVSKTLKNSQHFSSFWRSEYNFEKNTLAPGETTKVTVKYMYWHYPGEDDLEGSTFYIVLGSVMLESGYVASIQMVPYHESSKFRFVSEEEGAVDTVFADGENVEVKIDGGRIIVSNLTDAASVELYTVAGARVAQSAPDAGSPVILDGVARGAYLLRVTTGSSAPIVRKLLVP